MIERKRSQRQINIHQLINGSLNGLVLNGVGNITSKVLPKSDREEVCNLFI
jgi:hypothetical protein